MTLDSGILLFVIEPISNGVFPFAGILSSGLVTLESLQIFNNHEPLSREPSVYFRCQGENKTMLPDVKKTNLLYTFKGAESWQVCSFPLLFLLLYVIRS